MDGKEISYVSERMSYGALRVHLRDGEEVRLSIDEVFRILQSHTFELVKKRKFHHLVASDVATENREPDLDSVMDKVPAAIHEVLKRNKGEWPADDWISLTPNVDLNVFMGSDDNDSDNDEPVRKATLYSVYNGKTNTKVSRQIDFNTLITEGD